MSHSRWYRTQEIAWSPNGKFCTPSILNAEEFLEKIFQVPFWIPAMGQPGRLAVLGAALPKAGAAGQAQEQRGGGVRGDTGGTSGGTEGSNQRQPVVPLPIPEPVTLSKEEHAAILRWGAMAGDTPRRLKRFARSYMILRASLPREQRESFVAAGDYDTVARILAFGSAAPHLRPTKKPSRPADLGLWNRFFGEGTSPPSSDDISRWLPEIARFGFAEPNA